jgi:hypothetical protein
MPLNNPASTERSLSPGTTKQPPEKLAPGSSWKDNETHVLPKNRLGIVCLSILPCYLYLTLVKGVLWPLRMCLLGCHRPGRLKHSDVVVLP